MNAPFPRAINAPPRGEDMRCALLDRADRYHKLSGIGLSLISRAIIGSSAFLAHVAAGGNFTIGRYDRAMQTLEVLIAACDGNGSTAPRKAEQRHGEKRQQQQARRNGRAVSATRRKSRS